MTSSDNSAAVQERVQNHAENDCPVNANGRSVPLVKVSAQGLCCEDCGKVVVEAEEFSNAEG